MKEKISPTQKALNLWAVILIIWSIYRSQVTMPEYFDEFIAKPLVFVLPVYLYIRKVEKKDFFAALDIKSTSAFRNVTIGLLIGLVFILSAFFANFIKFNRLVAANQTPFSIQTVFLTFAIALATGISEEILSRGFILKRLYEESKNIYTSSFFASILFFFLHVPILFTNAKITGNLLLAFMAIDMVLSLVNSFIFLESKSLIIPILIHAFYNLTLSIFV